MQKVNVTLAMDEERFRALEYYLKQENTTVQKKLDEAMGQLYEQMVPGAVREFVDGVGGIRPKRPAPASKPQAGQKPKSEPKEAVSHEQP